MRRYPLFVVGSVAFAALTTPAYAYLDPGTGSMILQAIIGAVAVGAASMSVFWHRVKSFFSSASQSADSASAAEKDAPKH